MVLYKKAITYKKMIGEGIYGVLGAAVAYALFVFEQVPEENFVPSMVVTMMLLHGIMNYLKNKN